MTAHKEVLAIIPARGGSKGVRRKNIRLVGGKPLIAYSIQAALMSERITRVIVSTEDEEIAGIARQLGAEVPYLRPKVLALDRSRLDQVQAHVMRWLEGNGYVPDATCLLMPTHPFRTRRLIDSLIGRLDQGLQTVNTVVEARWKDLRTSDGMPVRFSYSQRFPSSCQGGIPQVRTYGLFAATSTRPAHGVHYHIIRNPVSCIDIDYEYDIWLANYLLSKNLFDFEEGYQGCWD